MGYKQITLAMEAAKKENLPLDFKLRFKPYLLDPSLPSATPLVKREIYHERYGKANFERMEQQMIARGKRVGIDFSCASRRPSRSVMGLSAYRRRGNSPADNRLAQAHREGVSGRRRENAARVRGGGLLGLL